MDGPLIKLNNIEASLKDKVLDKMSELEYSEAFDTLKIDVHQVIEDKIDSLSVDELLRLI